MKHKKPMGNSNWVRLQRLAVFASAHTYLHKVASGTQNQFISAMNAYCDRPFRKKNLRSETCSTEQAQERERTKSHPLFQMQRQKQIWEMEKHTQYNLPILRVVLMYVYKDKCTESREKIMPLFSNVWCSVRDLFTFILFRNFFHEMNSFFVCAVRLWDVMWCRLSHLSHIYLL